MAEITAEFIVNVIWLALILAPFVGLALIGLWFLRILKK